MLPQRFADIHPRYLTPAWATWGMGIASIAFYVLLTLVSENVLADSIAAVGLLIAFYYGLTGFACVWYFGTGCTVATCRSRRAAARGWAAAARRVRAVEHRLRRHGRRRAVFGIGGVFVIGIGALVLSAVLMLVYSRVAPAYFRGETLGRRVADRINR